jgi:hypothetical protein
MNYALRAVVAALILAFAGIAVVRVLPAVGFRLPGGWRRPQRLTGVRITSVEEPMIWAEVYRAASSLRITPPDTLLLIPDAKVVAVENKTWLGLGPGAWSLRLGLPLLVGLTERQLREVLTHELWRFGEPTSRGQVIDRGKEIMARILSSVGADSRADTVVGRHSRIDAGVSRPYTGGQVLDADRRSDLAGNGTIPADLPEAAVLSQHWDAFVDEYVEPAAAIHRRPQDLFAGFTSFLAEPTRCAQLAEASGQPSFQQQPAYDAHPTLRERLASIAFLTDNDIHDRSGPAIEMLRKPDREIRRVEDWMFHKSGLVPATWQEIVTETGCSAARADAQQLIRAGGEGGLGPALSVATVLDVIRHGLADEMVRPLLADGASQEDERQLAGRLVTAFLTTAAIESGTVSYPLNWAAPRQLVDDQGSVEDLPGLVDTALADGTEALGLELWLAAHEVGHELEPGGGVGTVATEIPRRQRTTRPSPWSRVSRSGDDHAKADAGAHASVDADVVAGVVADANADAGVDTDANADAGSPVRAEDLVTARMIGDPLKTSHGRHRSPAPPARASRPSVIRKWLSRGFDKRPQERHGPQHQQPALVGRGVPARQARQGSGVRADQAQGGPVRQGR